MAVVRRMRRERERGSMAVEVVLLIPALVAVMLLVVGFGRLADRQGDVEAAAREAARAASYERDELSAHAAAQQAASRVLPGGLSCDPVDVDGSFVAGGTVTVTVSCDVSYSGLGLKGLPGATTISGTSSAPLDQWRRTA